eukprot:355521-Chlamydomonas_euryale.AAC.9
MYIWSTAALMCDDLTSMPGQQPAAWMDTTIGRLAMAPHLSNRGHNSTLQSRAQFNSPIKGTIQLSGARSGMFTQLPDTAK